MVELIKITVKEFLRMKILYIWIIVGILLIVFSYILESLTINQWNKVIVDFSLSMIELFSLILTLFLWAYMLYNEFTKKTILLILSKLEKKYYFVLAKFFAFAFILFLMYFIFSIAFVVSLYFHNLDFHFYYLQAIFLSYLKILVILAFIIFFSTFVSPFLSLIAALFIYFVSHASPFMYYFSKFAKEENTSEITKKLLEFTYYVLPNFQDLSMKEYFLSPYLGNYTDFHFLISVLVWAFAYIFILLFFASFIFNKKEF